MLFVILAGLLLVPGYAGSPRLGLWGPRPSLTVTPLSPPAQLRSGRLTWLGAARLSSRDPAFGGFSALAVAGRRFTLLDDGGRHVTFTLDGGWRPGGARFGTLPDGPRSGWEKRDRDSESLASGPDGRLWVGFEDANEIWRYSPGFARAERHARPRRMRRWDGGGGPESLARLRDGRFVTIAETTRPPGQTGRAGIVFASDPTVRPGDAVAFTYHPAPGFDPSDMALTPDGDLIVLERRWLLPVRFRLRLALVPAAALRAGAQVHGTELGRIALPWPTENYEGLAVVREGPATILWLVSDNDQDWWRPSYLLKLRLD